MVLQAVFNRYQRLDLQFPQYAPFPQLTMFDAKNLIDGVIYPFVKREYRTPLRITMVLENFKCMACGKHSHPRYTFRALMGHIYRQHATVADASNDYHTLYRVFPKTYDAEFPWHGVPWPNNLPLVNEHYVAQPGLGWRADSGQGYQITPAPLPSLFLHRSYAPRVHLSFESCMQHVLDKCAPTLLEPLYIFTLAVEYIVRPRTDPWWVKSDAVGLLTNLETTFLRTQRHQYSAYATMLLQCSLCAHNEVVEDPLYPVRMARRTLDDLLWHLYSYHQDIYRGVPTIVRISALRQLIHLPSNEELAAAVARADEKLARKRAIKVTDRNAHRARLIAQKVTALSVVEDLFPSQ